MATAAAPAVQGLDRARVAPSVALGHRRLTARLASTPIEHLLLHDVSRPLGMAGTELMERVGVRPEAALEALRPMADAIITGDRPVIAPRVDSVLSVEHGRPIVLRRGRSLASTTVSLPDPVEPVVGCGTRADASFCLARGDEAVLSERRGRVESDEDVEAWLDEIDRRRRLFAIDPIAAGCDLDPNAVAARVSERLGLPLIRVQHDHGHVAAVMAEHGLREPVIGVAFDWHSLGEDGTTWGGEFLVCDWVSSRRVGNIRRVALPAADGAGDDTVRLAASLASDAGCLEQALDALDLSRVGRRRLVEGLDGPAGPDPRRTSSAGSLFAGVAGLTGACRAQAYEGQAVELLEEAADPSSTHEYPFDIAIDDGRLAIDTRPMVAAIVQDLARGRTAGQVAGRFHRSMSAAIVAMCRLVKMQTDVWKVCLAGGVFTDDLLRSDAAARLSSVGFDVFVPRRIPPGDDGVSLGQVTVAHARLTAGMV
jgi:hydrogenase maturation protein HypF